MIKIRKNPNNKLLVLDIDETLVFVENKWYFQNDKKLIPDFELYDGYYFGIKRPFLDQFLRDISKKYDLAIWTSGEEEYARIIYNKIFHPLKIKLKFIWTKNELNKTGNYKDLNLIKDYYPEYSKIIAIDDQSSYYKNKNDLILVKRFTGNESDTELIKVYNKL